MSALAVVVGANGGIGAALLNLLKVDGRYETVIGLSRTGDPALDLTDEASIAVCAAHNRRPRRRAAPDHRRHGRSDLARRPAGKVVAAPERRNPRRAVAVNAIGPALLMKHVLPLFPRKGRAVFATLSARVGSIGDNHLGGWYGYRASKAALNQFVRTASIELSRRDRRRSASRFIPAPWRRRCRGPSSKQGRTPWRPRWRRNG